MPGGRHPLHPRLTDRPGASRSFQIGGTNITGQGGATTCAVPDDATAVEVSVTVASPVGSGFLRIAPNDGTNPNASFINYSSGIGITNTGTVALSLTQLQDLIVRNFGGSAQVIIDVQGFYIGPPPPTVTGVSPSSGSTLGATSVTITGTGLTGATAVTFGAAPAASFTVNSATQITATAPAAAAGQVDVRVTSPSGSSVVSPSTTYPYDVTPLSGATQITAGRDHTCAIATGGTVDCWGANDSGQLGDGTTTDSSTPVTVTGVTGANQISAGSLHTCAIVAGGAVTCWSANSNGQLGNGTTTDSSTPVTVTGITGTTGATQIAGGGSHTCAIIVTGGAANCWGRNFEGTLGLPGPGRQSLVPVAVLSR